MAEPATPPVPEFTLEDEAPADAGEAGDAERLVRQYVEELKREIVAGVEPQPAPVAARRTIWAIGIGTVMTALVIFVLLWHQTVALSAAGQGAAAQARAMCWVRQMEVMDAITAYTGAHREPPPDLTTLHPKYLHNAAQDPVSGQRFRYAREGNAVWLACAEHPMTPQLQGNTAPVVAAADPVRKAENESEAETE